MAMRDGAQDRAATIVVEDSPGKLRGAGPAPDLNRVGAQPVDRDALAQANLAGITFVEVPRAYSTMIGNLAFEAPRPVPPP